MMGLFSSTEFNSLEDLLVEQLHDLYDAENQLVDALPKMVEAATAPELKSAFSHHLDQTRTQVTRLEQACELLGAKARRESCEAMKGLIKASSKMIDATGEFTIKDAALIAAAQRVEHYEMADYGSARTFAQQCGHQDVADLLQQTLDEESNANYKLTQIAENSINVRAARV